MALSASNQQIKQLRRLLGRRAARHEEGLFVVEGAISVVAACRSGADVQRVFVDEDGVDPDELLAGGPPVERTAAGVLESVLSTKSPQPICATVAHLHQEPADVLAAAAAGGGFVLVCAGVADPGNAGTLIRTAHASGAAAVMLTDTAVDLYNPKTVRSTAGSIFSIPISTVGTPAELVEMARAAGLRTWASSSHVAGAVPHTEADLVGPTAVLIGNEAHGLEAGVIAACDRGVRVDIESSAESINAAMAGTIICFEARRQRGL